MRDKGVANGNAERDRGGARRSSRSTVDWGHYRLEVYDAASGHGRASVRFYAGWWAKPGHRRPRPTACRSSADKPLYQRRRPGGSCASRAPFTGQALVDDRDRSRAGDAPGRCPGCGQQHQGEGRCRLGRRRLCAGERFPARAEGEADQHGPGRAIGTAWLAIDPKPRAACR